MLVLSRKCGETIVIADNITVTVLEVHHGRIKLGVTADAGTSIHRGELHDRIMHAVSANPVHLMAPMVPVHADVALV
jgi:carbon storage regulator